MGQIRQTLGKPQADTPAADPELDKLKEAAIAAYAAAIQGIGTGREPSRWPSKSCPPVETRK